MDPFSYLSVLISIILALSVAHLLSALVRVIHNRSRTVIYWPTLAYTFTLFVVVIQVWWVDFHLSRHTDWTFAGFVSTMLGPADIYLLCALLLPSADISSADNMRTAYQQNRKWFLGALLLLPALSFHQDWMLDGNIGSPADIILKLIFEALILLALIFNSEFVQKTVAATGAILIVIYVELIFNTLHY
jgi:hypothetical protein